MERLLVIADIMERYQCNTRTARNYMREMGILKKNPMMVRETAADAWERKREQESLQKGARKQSAKPAEMISLVGQIPKPKPGQYISRERPKRRDA